MPKQLLVRLERINKPFARKYKSSPSLDKEPKLQVKTDKPKSQRGRKKKSEPSIEEIKQQLKPKKEEDLEKMALAKSFKVLKSGQNKNGEPSQVRSLLKQESVIYQKSLSKPCHHKNMLATTRAKRKGTKKVSSSSSNPSNIAKKVRKYRRVYGEFNSTCYRVTR